MGDNEYEMTADSVTVVPVVTWNVRRIIKKYSKKSFSSGLSQRVVPNGGSQGADMNNNEVTAMAQIAIIAAS